MTDTTADLAKIAATAGCDTEQVKGLMALCEPNAKLAYDTANFRWIAEEAWYRELADRQIRQASRTSPLAGYVVLQHCPVCQRHRLTRSRGMTANAHEWNAEISAALPVERWYEEFACDGGHSFRTSCDSPAQRRPAPGT